MKKSAIAMSLISLALIIGAGIGIYRHYQANHISSDLRRTLTAAVDPRCSMNDELTYLRDARAQVRSLRDAQLEDYLQSAVESMQTDFCSYLRNMMTTSNDG
jgi:predicted Zn-dependent protease